MKVLICVLTVFVATCNGGFLFAASGFFGGVDKDLKSYVVNDVAEKVIIPEPVLGVSKVIKTLPKVYADVDDISGRTAVSGGVVVSKPLFGFSKVIKTFPKVYADYGGISGRAITPGEVLVSKQVFGIPKLVKTIPNVYVDPHIFNGRRVLPEIEESDRDSDRGGYVAHGSGGVDAGQQEGETIKLILTEDERSPQDGADHAHQDIKTIKVIRVAAERGGNVGHGGHTTGEGSHQEIKTIQVVTEDERSDGLSGLGASAGPYTRDYNNQYGVVGGQQVVKTIKVIQDYNPYQGRHNGPGAGFSNGGFDGYSGNDGNHKIKTIKVSYAGDGGAEPLVYGGQKGYGSFDNKYYQQNLFKVIH